MQRSSPDTIKVDVKAHYFFLLLLPYSPHSAKNLCAGKSAHYKTSTERFTLNFAPRSLLPSGMSCKPVLTCICILFNGYNVRVAASHSKLIKYHNKRYKFVSTETMSNRM